VTYAKKIILGRFADVPGVEMRKYCLVEVLGSKSGPCNTPNPENNALK
jgi:hypothetical protein